jgi:hypothetical protein
VEFFVTILGSYNPREETLWSLFEENQNRLKDFPSLKEEVYVNELGLPNGRIVKGWKIPKDIPREALEGVGFRVEPLTATHHSDLLKAFLGQDEMWKFSRYGPFEDSKLFKSWIENLESRPDQMLFSVVDSKINKATGMAAFVAINPELGSIQIGHIHFSSKIGVICKRKN